MMETFIIADSRHIIPQTFEVEAAFGSYHRFLITIIPKYIAICDNHLWMRRPTGLIILSDSADTPKIISSRFLEVSIASKNLEPPPNRLAGSGNKIVGETWRCFLVSAIHKITEMLIALSLQLQITRESEGRVIIYSSDLLLVGSALR